MSRKERNSSEPVVPRKQDSCKSETAPDKQFGEEKKSRNEGKSQIPRLAKKLLYISNQQTSFPMH